MTVGVDRHILPTLPGLVDPKHSLMVVVPTWSFSRAHYFKWLRCRRTVGWRSGQPRGKLNSFLPKVLVVFRLLYRFPPRFLLNGINTIFGSQTPGMGKN